MLETAGLPGAVAAIARRPAGVSLRRFAGAAVALLLLAGCQADEEMSFGSGPKHLREVPRETRAAMQKLDMATDAPVLMRIFKEESAFEVWKQDRTGRYQLLKTYEICKWSGGLGPKIKEGDRQAPEGYYMITPALMNPNSNYFLAFNTGFPNAYDRALGRTGTHLMVHGSCSSRGCYAMTDAQIQEIYALARDAFRGGQKAFQLAAYPFRMTPENIARHVDNPHMPFWRMLKEGYDHFELTRREPRVDVCGRKYVFNVTSSGPLEPTAACPALSQPEELRVAAAKKAAEDDAKVQVIAAALAEEKRQAEEKAFAIAAREEERRRLEEERRLAMAQRGEAIASLFGTVTGAAAPDPQPAPATVAAIPRVDEAGRPLPRPAPRETGPVMAMQPAATADTGSQSMFSRLFSFGGEDAPAALPIPAEPTLAAPSGPVIVPAAATAGVPAAAPAVVGAPGLAAAAPPAAAVAAVADPSAIPGACTGADGSAVPCSPVAAPAPVSEADRSIIDRIGSWF